MSMRAGERKADGAAAHLRHDGLRAVGGDQRYLRTQPGKLANRVQIENHVLVQGHAPALQQAGQRVIFGDRRSPN